MRMLLRSFLILGVLACPLTTMAADVVEQSWVFNQPGNAQGWLVRNFGVNQTFTSESFTGDNVGAQPTNDPHFISPNSLGVPAQYNHYIQVRMKLSKPNGQRFSQSEGYIYFTTESETVFGDDKRVQFMVYGNNAWRTFNVRMALHSKWTGTIRRIRLDPATMENVKVEVASIKFMRDTTPPDFNLTNIWNYEDNEVLRIQNPTVHVQEAWDDVAGLNRVFYEPAAQTKAQFFSRPAGGTEQQWTIRGTDSSPENGFQYTYPNLANGSYDLGVRLYDSVGNFSDWNNLGEKAIISNITINTASTMKINVDAAQSVRPVNKKAGGVNLINTDYQNLYDPVTKKLPQDLEDLTKLNGAPVLRYPGGCFSDTFFWKRAIGPIASRGENFHNPCGPVLNSIGMVKFGLDEWLQFCEARGFEPMYTVRFRWQGANGIPGIETSANAFSGALQDALDLVEYVNAPNDGSNWGGGADWAAVRAANGRQQPYGLKYFEIGNEPWGPDPWGSPANINQYEGEAIYGRDFLIYYEAMKALDPTIVVTPSFNPWNDTVQTNLSNPEWGYTVYSYVAPFVTEIQNHPYYPYSAWQTDMNLHYLESQATSKTIQDFFDKEQNYVKWTHPDRAGQLKVHLTEWNINYNWWYDPSQGRINTYHTRTHKAALAALDCLRVFQENPQYLASAEWWHLNGSGAWGLIYQGGGNPVHHAYRMFNSHFGDTQVKSKVLGSPVFDWTGYGSEERGLRQVTSMSSVGNDGALYLIVLNRDKDNAHTFQINLANFLQGSETSLNAEIWTMYGETLHDPDHPDTTTTVTNASYSSSFNYQFPKHSAVGFKFTRPATSFDSIGALKGANSGLLVQLMDRVITAEFPPSTLYVEDDSRAAGIRIETTNMSSTVGNRATVTGTLSVNAHGEPYIAATNVAADSSNVSMVPLKTNQKVHSQAGLTTTGLLLEIWGTVTATSTDSFYLDDGMGILSFTGNKGLKVLSSANPQVGKYVKVIGVKSQAIPAGGTNPEPVIWVKSPGDVEIVF